MKRLIVIILLIFVTACASFGTRASDDPLLLLQEASELYGTERDPVRAEELIHEAMALAVGENNLAALAEAYRQYGLFFRSNAVGRFEAHYRKEGFLDEHTTFDKRYDRSLHYLRAAEVLFAKQQRFDSLSEVYLGLAKTYLLMADMPKACEAFDQSILSNAAHRKALAAAAGTPLETPDPQEEYLKTMKQQAGCP